MEHSRFGYSAVSTFEQCPHRYKLTYLDDVRLIPSDDPQNALIIGSAMHKGIETDVETAISWYFSQYPIITDKHIDEEIKLRHWIPKVKEIIPDGSIHETRIKDDHFIGTADLLVPADDGTLELWDFKYSNNTVHYLDSRQLHLYKHYLEKTTDIKVSVMGFIFIPKIQIKQKKTEDLFQFRQRLRDELNQANIELSYVDYDANMVIEHLERCQDINSTTEYNKNVTRLCDWCQYKNLCQKGENYMVLPSTNRVTIDTNNFKKIWIYGAPFSGKTTLVDSAPTPLNLNTDGNVKNVTMARLPIKDIMDGRQKKLAWDVFKEAIDELEAGSDFETIVVDLLEDTYESCRLYMYKQMGITHESDDSFRAWDKVRTEFLSTIRRLMNLDYNVILISHEDASKDITKRTGDKVTAIKPNIQDKIANKISGMVDIVIRAIKEDDNFTLSTRTSNVVFGGGRLTGMKANDIPNSWDSIEAMYGSDAPEKPKKAKKASAEEVCPDVEETPTQTTEAVEKDETPDEEAPKRRTRRQRA